MTPRSTLSLLWPALLFVASSAVASERFEYRKLVMGTEARIVLYADAEDVAQDAAGAAFAAMEGLEVVLSDWRADSEVSALAARAGSGPVPVSETLFAVLTRAQEIARASAGGFDVTVGPYVALWRQAREDGALPTAEALATARAAVGFEKMRLDPEARTVALDVEGMVIDLGGIGKGVAADAALATLRERGFPRALIDLGGDLVLGDAPPEADGWTVDAGCGEDRRRHVVANCAVATSGDTEQFVDLGGVRYSHIVDPRTGLGLTSSLCVSVFAADGATADALASAASVLGRRAGRALVRASGAELQVLDPGLRPAFPADGLDGWEVTGGARAARADGLLTARLGEDGAGGRLRTVSPLSAFELALEVRLTGALEVSLLGRETADGRGIEVTFDSRDGGGIATVSAGGEEWANDAASGRWRPGEWNHVELRITDFDPRVEVWLDGEKISDVRPARSARDSGAFAPCGPLAFVLRGGDIDAKFEARNVAWRELPVFPEDIAFTPLFDGASLGGWEISDRHVDGYRVVDGCLELLNVEGSGYLRTVRDFRDFRLRLDFRIAAMTNGGVFLRAARNGENPAYSGCEVQILDDAHWAAASEIGLEPSQRLGSLYGSVAPGVDAARPIGEWNTFEILYRGTRLAVALNGRALYDVDTLTVPGKPFAGRAPAGFIGLQRTGSTEVEDEVAIAFRRIEIQPIEE